MACAGVFHPGHKERGVAGQPPTVNRHLLTQAGYCASLAQLPPSCLRPAPQADLPPAFQGLPRPSSLQPTMVLRQESERPWKSLKESKKPDLGSPPLTSGSPPDP